MMKSVSKSMCKANASALQPRTIPTRESLPSCPRPNIRSGRENTFPVGVRSELGTGISTRSTRSTPLFELNAEENHTILARLPPGTITASRSVHLQRVQSASRSCRQGRFLVQIQHARHALYSVSLPGQLHSSSFFCVHTRFRPELARLGHRSCVVWSLGRPRREKNGVKR